MFPNDPRAAALDYYFDRNPDPGQATIIIFRAEPGDYLARFEGRPVHCLQSDKPAADALARQGFGVHHGVAPKTDLCIVFATKHKEETLYHLARAATLLAEGGSLVMVAANDLGAGSLERRCAELLGEVESYSKHKCRVIRAQKHTARLNHSLMENWLRAGDWRPIVGTGFVSRPGMFSWKTLDLGSRLLVQHLPDNLSGRGADLGAGYGYLSRELLDRSRHIDELYLFEAEHKALDAAERNLAGHKGKTLVYYRWADVTSGLPVSQLDFVVTNPPFHAGREAMPGLGRAFIRAGLAALRAGGRLFLVANRHLPYEAEIAAQGARADTLAVEGGFKVIQVVKRG